MNLYNLQVLEFYWRKEKPLGLDIQLFVNFFYIDQMVTSMLFQIRHTNVTYEDVNSLEGQKRASIRQNLTLLRKECVITHISLQMNLYIVLLGAQYIDSSGAECV